MNELTIGPWILMAIVTMLCIPIAMMLRFSTNVLTTATNAVSCGVSSNKIAVVVTIFLALLLYQQVEASPGPCCDRVASLYLTEAGARPSRNMSN